MNRKQFITWNAALLGSLSLPLKGRAAASTRDIAAAASAGDDEALWKVVRDQFLLDPGWTYLNFGGLGACPLPVLESLDRWSRVEESAPNADHDKAEWTKAKEKVAGLLGKGCRREDLAFIGCATEGVNAIVNGLPLRKGDEVITSTHEHVAVNAALLNRMQRDGIVIKLFEPDLETAEGNVGRIAAQMTPRTRLILISHVTCTTGQRFPERAIADLARAKGVWYALDGAQAPVNVPFDIAETGADVYTCSTHKWMMGPKRTGFLWVRPEFRETLRPVTVGMSSCERTDIWKREMVFQPSAERYETGTQNDALFYALGTACDLIQAIGPERIRARGRAMAERFWQGLAAIPGVERLAPAEEAYRSCIITFRMKDLGFEAVYDHLRKDRIAVRRIQEGKLWAIRVSFFLNNRMQDVDVILDSLKRLASA